MLVCVVPEGRLCFVLVSFIGLHTHPGNKQVILPADAPRSASMPRSVRGLGDAQAGRRDFLKQESYSLKGQSSRPTPEESVSDATTLIRTCEAWATEAFRLPADFLNSLAQPGKKRRSAACCGGV